MLQVTSSMLWARFSRWMAMNELQERASTILQSLTQSQRITIILIIIFILNHIILITTITLVPEDNHSNHHLYPHPYHPHHHYHLPRLTRSSCWYTAMAASGFEEFGS